MWRLPGGPPHPLAITTAFLEVFYICLAQNESNEVQKFSPPHGWGCTVPDPNFSPAFDVAKP